MIGAREFARIPRGAAFLLMSRAAVVDFPAMLTAVERGHIRAATDVFPEEPVALDDPVRRLDGLLVGGARHAEGREGEDEHHGVPAAVHGRGFRHAV